MSVTQPQRDRKRIYVSGPLTSSGDIEENVYKAKLETIWLIEHGFAPLCPALTYYIEALVPFPHETWMAVDLPWVRVSDGVLRLPGSSSGADQEERKAFIHGVPVFYSRQELLEWKWK